MFIVFFKVLVNIVNSGINSWFGVKQKEFEYTYIIIGIFYRKL